MKKRIFLSSPHMSGDELKLIEETFQSNWIAPLGPQVDAFEKEVASYLGVKAAVALNSGTSAIHLGLKVLEVKKDDIVFCSSLTFAASCNPIIYENAEPVFIDSEPNSFNLCPEALNRAFTHYLKKGVLPKAVIVVHLYGQSAKMDEIKTLCDKYKVPILEDSAEALGATYKNKYCGSLGEFGAFSFNGNKIITTSGGGMMVSNNEDAIEKIRFFATQAKDKARHYEHSELGYNYRMSNVLAAIGRAQFRVLAERIAKKKFIYDTYKESFKNIEEITMMPICDYGNPNYWLSVITLSKDSKVTPLDIILALEKENIESRPLWKPMHLQPYYKKYSFYLKDDSNISIAEDLFNRGLCLPSDTHMTEEDIRLVIAIVKKLFEEKNR